jgi:hypothetical protein
MHGLSVRWSLAGCPAEVLDELASYVESSSYGRFSSLDGLRFKTWRARAGEWFEGTYVFASDAQRAAFQASFEAMADETPVSLAVGSAPVAIEPWDVVAVAEGPEGFLAAPRY